MRQLLVWTIIIGSLGITHLARAETYYLSWRANSYTPPSYLGKALPVKGSTLVVSIDSLEHTIPNSLLSYTWYFDDTRFADGYGLNHTQMPITQKPGVYTLKVFISYPDDSSETITQLVPVVSPLLLLTEKNNAIRNGVMYSRTDTFNFTATPYFFNIISLLDLNFLWSIGGVTSNDQSPEKPNQATITIPEETPNNTTNSLQVIATNLRNNRERALQTVNIITR